MTDPPAAIQVATLVQLRLLVSATARTDLLKIDGCKYKCNCGYGTPSAGRVCHHVPIILH
jgi:hypothetical protein